MRHSMAWPFGAQQRRRIQIEPLAARDPNLPAHEIEAGHHLGDRVLDLQPRVHLEEIEAAVLVEQELDRAGVGVADRLRDRGGRRRHRRAQRRRDRQRRRLLDDLLVAALNRALALDERQHRAVRVAEQLHFDVARPRQPALEIDRGVAERGARFRSRGADGAGEVGRRRRPCACPCRRRRRPPSPAADSRSPRRPSRSRRRARRRRADPRCRARPARRRAWPPSARRSCCPSSRSPPASGR